MKTFLQLSRSPLLYILIGAAGWMLVSAALGTGTPAAQGLQAPPHTPDRRNWLPVALRDAYLAACPAQKYYLTTGTGFDGSEARTACAAGYHMASLWEIFHFTGLDYDRDLGVGPFDATAGPPTGFAGWIRTGSQSNTDNEAGTGNCASYTSASATDYGTQVVLTPIWDGGGSAGLPISPWSPISAPCSMPRRVWCVQD